MKKNSFFWVSFSDLMTTMFFIMLVLFVVSISGFKLKEHVSRDNHHKINSLERIINNFKDSIRNLNETAFVLNKDKKKLQELQNAIQALPGFYFEYQSSYKRFELRLKPQFSRGSSVINERYHKYLYNAGKALNSTLTDLSNRYKDYDIRYLLVIEGMASKDNYSYNYELSYKRALSLYRLWEKQGINFDPKVCEVQIAGSGTGGLGRYNYNSENKNQRFLIQIIPKIGKF